MIYIRSYNFQGDSQWSFSITYRYRVYFQLNWKILAFDSKRDEERIANRKGMAVRRTRVGWISVARNLGTTESVNITRYSFRLAREAMVKSRGKRGDTYSRGRIRRHEKLETLHESFLPAVLPEIRVSENLREREKNYRFLPWKREVTRILSDYFFFVRNDIIRRCNESGTETIFSSSLWNFHQGSFFPWIRRGVS